MSVDSGITSAVGGAAPLARSGGRTAPARPARLPGLDGLRAVAIIAVLIFHLNPRWLPGGFIGVDVFLVISGFLITTLLIREHARTGHVDLARFWTRRARRLLPALIVMVPAVVLIASVVERDLLVGIGRQVLGAFTFTSNWLEIGAGSDYFTSTSPQLLMNLWSLAVEEQFYLLWPLAALLLFRHASSTRTRVGITLALAAVSAALMAALYSPGEAATRVYYGTDTHLFGLMIGAALAFAYAASHRSWTHTAAWNRFRRWVIASSALTLLAAFALLDESSALTFRGGILLASLATAGLILGVIDRPGSARSAMSGPIVRWIGERSYGIYLWHWPVILIVEADLDWAREPATGYLWSRLWCLIVIATIADLSYRFIEQPVRELGFRGAGAKLIALLRRSGTRTARGVWAAVAVVAMVVVTVMVTAPKRTSVEESLARNEASMASPSPASTSPSPSPTPTGSPDSGNWAMPSGAEIDAIGDSVLVGSLHAMRYYFDGIRIDARSNRQWAEGVSAVEALGDGARRGVVLSLGTNAGVDKAQATRALDALGSDRMVVLVTLHGRIGRIASDNTAIRELAQGRDNVAIADWDAALKDTTGMLQSDQMHPSIAGAHLYAATVRQAFADLSQRHTGKKVELQELPRP